MADPVSVINLGVIIVGALAGWTASVVAAVLWLNSKFRALELMFYREMNKERRANMILFQEHNDRLLRLELKQDGYVDVRPIRPQS